MTVPSSNQQFHPLIAPGSIPRSLLRTFNFEIWKLKCLGACPEDLYCLLFILVTYHCFSASASVSLSLNRTDTIEALCTGSMTA